VEKEIVAKITKNLAKMLPYGFNKGTSTVSQHVMSTLQDVMSTALQH